MRQVSKVEVCIPWSENESTRPREWWMQGWTTRKRELEEFPDIRKLEFGVRVRADFAVEIDLFVLRRDPFHGCGSLENSSATGRA